MHATCHTNLFDRPSNTRDPCRLDIRADNTRAEVHFSFVFCYLFIGPYTRTYTGMLCHQMAAAMVKQYCFT